MLFINTYLTTSQISVSHAPLNQLYAPIPFRPHTRVYK